MISTNNWYRFYKLAFRNKLDLFSKKLAKDVLNNLLKSEENRGKFQYIIGSDKEKELNDYDVREIVFMVDLFAVAFRVVGHYLPEQSAVVINIAVSPKMLLKDYRDPTKSKVLSKNYEDILQEVKYTIRHELEHAHYNKMYNYEEPAYNIPSKVNSYLEYALLTRQYLLDASEMDSYIRELMLKAKNKRVLIDNLLVEMVNNKVIEIAPDTMKKELEDNTENGKAYRDVINEILSSYRNRINSIYNRGR